MATLGVTLEKFSVSMTHMVSNVESAPLLALSICFMHIKTQLMRHSTVLRIACWRLMENISVLMVQEIKAAPMISDTPLRFVRIALRINHLDLEKYCLPGKQ